MVQFESSTEAEIIKRIIDGEKPLYELIVRRFNPYLYKIGRSYNYNHEDTQDLMQETFIDAYKNLSKFEGRADFKTWLVRIMMNNCYRKKEKLSFKKETSQTVKDNAKPMFMNVNNATDSVVHNRELRCIMENAIIKLPIDYRMVFSLREINELNVSETASLLGITEANVKVRLNRSKALLRNEIEKICPSSELFEFNLIYCDAMVKTVMKRINNYDKDQVTKNG